jgi:hypothetical protein
MTTELIKFDHLICHSSSTIIELTRLKCKWKGNQKHNWWRNLIGCWSNPWNKKQNKSKYLQFFIFNHDWIVKKTNIISWVCTKEQWYFVTKIVFTYCEKKMFYWSRKTFEIRGWRPRICKIFEITRTIFSNSERSEQFLVTECFFNLFLEVSHI